MCSWGRYAIPGVEPLILLMVWSDGKLYGVLIFAMLIFLNIYLGEEFDAVEITKSIDTASTLSCLRIILILKATGRVEDSTDEGPPHVSPFRSLMAEQSDQAPDFAPGVLSFGDNKLTVEVYRA